MEATKRERKLFDRPFLGGLVAIIIAQFVIANLSIIPPLGLEVIRGVFLEAAMSDELVNSVKYVGLIIAALLYLLIHRLWFRKFLWKFHYEYH